MKIVDWYKSKPYWLKIGIIGFFIGLISTAPIFCEQSLELFKIANNCPIFSILAPFTYLAIPNIGLFYLMLGEDSFYPFYGVIFSPITYFIFGTLIGVIIQKIKPIKP